MFIHAGHYLSRTPLGWGVEFCPVCRAPRMCVRVGVARTPHLNLIPIGGSKPALVECRCMQCRVLFHAATPEGRAAWVKPRSPVVVMGPPPTLDAALADLPAERTQELTDECSAMAALESGPGVGLGPEDRQAIAAELIKRVEPHGAMLSRGQVRQVGFWVAIALCTSGLIWLCVGLAGGVSSIWLTVVPGLAGLGTGSWLIHRTSRQMADLLKSELVEPLIASLTEATLSHEEISKAAKQASGEAPITAQHVRRWIRTMLASNAKAARALRRGGAEALLPDSDQQIDGRHIRPEAEEFEPSVPSPMRPGTLLGKLRKRGATGGQADRGRDNPFTPKPAVGSARPR